MNPETTPKNAFVLKISPSGDDLVPEALQTGEIIIGWAWAEGLLDPALDWPAFREIVRSTYYPEEPTLHSAGNAAGHLWRFIREMVPGDLVVVPHWSEFYVAEITGAAIRDASKVEADSAYRRPVRWLNEGRSIPRSHARLALISRMKIRGTCADASDLVAEIEECLNLAEQGVTPTFQNDLQGRLVRETLAEIRGGRIENYGFEQLIGNVLEKLGATDVRIVPRINDMGADLVAFFRVAGVFRYKVAVQAKHWQPYPPVGRAEVEQLINGIEAEAANLGMLITSGTIAEEAYQMAEQYLEEKGVRIEMVDGEQFSKLIVESGITTGTI